LDKNTTFIHAPNGRISGQINGQTLLKHITGDDILLAPPALALPTAVIAQAHKVGVQRVTFDNVENGRLYTASLSTFDYEGKDKGQGDSRQRVLPLSFFTITSKKKRDRAARPSVQLSLLGGEL